LIQIIHQARRFSHLGREISEGDAGEEKQGCQNCRGSGEKIARTPRTEDGGRSTAAEGSSHIRALTMLDQHQADESDGEEEMENG